MELENHLSKTNSTRALIESGQLEPFTSSGTSTGERGSDAAPEYPYTSQKLSLRPSSPKKRYASITQPPGSPTKKNKSSQKCGDENIGELGSCTRASSVVNSKHASKIPVSPTKKTNYVQINLENTDTLPFLNTTVPNIAGNDERVELTSEIPQIIISASTEKLPGEKTNELHDSRLQNMIREWEDALLNPNDPNARVTIKVGTDGRDEYTREPYSSASFAFIAAAIIAAGPTSDPTKHVKDISDDYWLEKEVVAKGIESTRSACAYADFLYLVPVPDESSKSYHHERYIWGRYL